MSGVQDKTVYQAFWADYLDACDSSGEPDGIDRFGDSADMADELLALVLSGDKQATCDLARNFEEGYLPRPGDRWIITDGSGMPRCVIQTRKVDVKPFSEATAEFAFTEGEGDKSLAYWHREHVAYFERQAAREGWAFTEDMDAVFEEFDCVWTGQGGS